ncbi:MAG: hypothetical protein ACOCP8_07205 [archaeon]
MKYVKPPKLPEDKKNYEGWYYKYKIWDNIDRVTVFKNIIKSSNKNNKTALVYTFWNKEKEGYIYFTYYSILSFYLYTDIENVDIHIFIDKKINKKMIMTLLYNLGDNINIHFVNKKKAMIYNVMKNKYLKKYKNVFMADCDLFVYGKKQNLFSNLEKLYDENFKDILVWNEVEGFENVLKKFKLYREFNCQNYKTEKESIAWLCQALNMTVEEINNRFRTKMWPMSPIIYFSPEKHFNDKLWNKYTEGLVNDVCSWDDEASLYFYLTKKDYDTVTLQYKYDNYICMLVERAQEWGLNKITDLSTFNNELWFLHPGARVQHWVGDFYKYIEKIIISKLNNK